MEIREKNLEQQDKEEDPTQRQKKAATLLLMSSFRTRVDEDSDTSILATAGAPPETPQELTSRTAAELRGEQQLGDAIRVSSDMVWILGVVMTVAFVLAVLGSVRFSSRLGHGNVCAMNSDPYTLQKCNNLGTAAWALMGVPFVNLVLSGLFMKSAYDLEAPLVGS